MSNKNRLKDLETFFKRPPAGKILLLTGPSGSGKLTGVLQTLEALSIKSRQVSFEDLREFERFLVESAKYPWTLSLQGEDAIGKDGVLLVKEAPFCMTHDESKVRFRRFLSQIPVLLSTWKAIVFIINESLYKDFRLNTAFGNVPHIEFKANAKSHIAKALGTGDKALAEKICEASAGDFRYAQTMKEWMALGTRQKTLSKPARKRPRLTNSTMAETVVSERDDRIGLFHALGKVLYAKRLETSIQLKLPPHLSRHDRLHPPKDDILNILDDTKWISDSGYLLALMHANLLQLRQGSTVQSVFQSLSYLSDADLLRFGVYKLDYELIVGGLGLFHSKDTDSEARVSSGGGSHGFYSFVGVDSGYAQMGKCSHEKLTEFDAFQQRHPLWTFKQFVTDYRPFRDFLEKPRGEVSSLSVADDNQWWMESDDIIIEE